MWISELSPWARCGRWGETREKLGSEGRVGLGELHLFLLKIKQNTALLYAFIPEAAKFGAEQKDSLSEMLK